ncbi:unnamed protein product, partial [Ectocarpus sp. 12 AP-2014]
GTSPLHLASCRGHVGVVHELLSAGADATRGDQFGYSALHLAGRCGDGCNVVFCTQHVEVQ